MRLLPQIRSARLLSVEIGDIRTYQVTWPDGHATTVRARGYLFTPGFYDTVERTDMRLLPPPPANDPDEPRAA